MVRIHSPRLSLRTEKSSGFFGFVEALSPVHPYSHAVAYREQPPRPDDDDPPPRTGTLISARVVAHVVASVGLFALVLFLLRSVEAQVGLHPGRWVNTDNFIVAFFVGGFPPWLYGWKRTR